MRIPGGQIAPFFLQTKPLQSLNYYQWNLVENYPRARNCRNETGNGKGRKVGIEYVYPQTTTISILPPIILLLLSEGYPVLAFNYENQKIALVGSGRRSEDRKRKRSYTIWVSCGCFTLQIDRRRFTMGGVKKKSKSHRRDVREARRRAVSFILSNLDQRLVRKFKNSGKKARATYYTFHVWIDWSEIHKSKRQRKKQKRVYYYSWLIGLVHGKKTGCRRRIVIKEDLVAEDKPRLVSSRVGPSCR